MILWDSINIYFEPDPKPSRKLRRSKKTYWPIFQRSWMILTGSIMTIAFCSCFHPYDIPVNCMLSTLVRAFKIADFVNLSPVTLLLYNMQQINQVKHQLFHNKGFWIKGGTLIDSLSAPTSTPTSSTSTSTSTLDLLPFLSEMQDHIFHIDGDNSLKNSFDYAISHCPSPKICTALTKTGFNSSLFNPLSSSINKKFPIIFDSGASVAISGFKNDFVSDIQEPSSEIRLGGMANGMLVKGIGKVKWSLQTGSDTVVIHTQCYYVPNAKVRLISPQRLFNKAAGIEGSFNLYEEYSTLLFKDLPSIKIDYDENNYLPIAYAKNATFSPIINLSVMDGGNQNLTPAQKLLLHWHY